MGGVSATATARKVDSPVAPRINDAQLRRLKIKGFSDAEIARRVGCTRQNISKRLRGIWAPLDRHETEAYSKNEVLLLQDTKRLVLTELRKPARLKESSTRDLTILFGVVDDKHFRRSTGMSDVFGLHVLVESVERARRDALATTGGVIPSPAAIPTPQVPAIAGERA